MTNPIIIAAIEQGTEEPDIVDVPSLYGANKGSRNNLLLLLRDLFLVDFNSLKLAKIWQWTETNTICLGDKSEWPLCLQYDYNTVK